MLFEDLTSTYVKATAVNVWFKGNVMRSCVALSQNWICCFFFFTWTAPLTDSGLSVVPGIFLLFQYILILSHRFPGSQTRVCVCARAQMCVCVCECCCLLCKPCSHHLKESLGMKSRKKSEYVSFSLIPHFLF